MRRHSSAGEQTRESNVSTNELSSAHRDRIRGSKTKMFGRDDGGAKERVRATQQLREKRLELFGAHLFSDPAWDILLALYLGDLTDGTISTTKLCAASNVPDTTLLRWIWRLEQEGWVKREPDTVDRRRIFVRLTENARTRMRQLLG